jgi:hypothetical protein
MIWIISIVLCLILLIAILAVLMPGLVLPFIAKLWEKQSYYSK